MTFTELAIFAGRMNDVINYHWREKGETWRMLPLERLKRLLDREIDEYQKANSVEQKMDELVDIAIVSAMIWHRLAPRMEEP